MTLYNEIDPYPAQWLRNLIAHGWLEPGEVDERSIKELDNAPGRAHFFAGIGGWPLALDLARWPKDRPVWTGSCPCQPFSAAGKKRGFADDRHLWPSWFRLIEQCRPPVIFGEQVASPDGLKWLDAVSADLEGAGYAFGAADLCAAGVGAPHLRQRLYFVAYRDECFSGQGRALAGGRDLGGDAASRPGSGGGGVLGRLANDDETRRGFVGSGGISNEREASRRNDADGRGEAGGLAYSSSSTGFSGRARQPGDAGQEQPAAERDRAASLLADPKRGRGRARGSGATDRGSAVEPDRHGAASLVGDPSSSSRGGRDPGGVSGAEAQGGGAGGAVGCVPDFLVPPGPWRCAWIPCADGKQRPVEPGSFPLAHGVPGRVGRLRAYGNAIVPQVAATFVRAFMETFL